MSNAYFAFRQFGIRQDRCAMKVSTDACIFGAWTPIPVSEPLRILDIGAGTGLLSLMMAQRCPAAQIDAVELDPVAASQASENIADSIFSDRVRLITGDARAYVASMGYDLILSNPPFFSRSLKGPDGARNAARHDDSLTIESLFEIAARLLKIDGHFSLLMPRDAADVVRESARGAGFEAVRRLDIADNASLKPKRSCWLYRRNEAVDLVPELLIVRNGTAYSAAFRELLSGFYLRC